MSGITGIWNTDGEPVSREVLSAMSARLSHRGPDGEHILLCGSAGFAYQALRVTPESMTEVQPLQHLGGAVLLLDGRLDNRDELVTKLAVPKETPDAGLVMGAFAAYGDEFVVHLNGDFALAIFDPQRQRLLLARDVMGQRSLHYARCGNHFVFASEIKALLAHPAVTARPDDRSLAEWLFHIPDYADESNTFFAGIHRVPPANLVIVDARETRLHRYWDFDVNRTVRCRDYREYLEAYRQCFRTAVERRLRSAFPVAITVSGGLDSSSIYCVTQEVKGSSYGQESGFFGIGLVGEHPTTNEEVFQNAVEEKYGVKLERIPFVATNAMGKPGEDVWHCEGPYLKWDIWRDLFRASMRRGSRVVLSGYFGDQLLQNPQYLLDLFFGLRWVTAQKHLRGFYDWWDGQSFAETTQDLYHGLKGYLIPEGLRPIYHRLRRTLRSTNIDYLPWYSERFLSVAAELERDRTPLPIPPCRAHAKILYQHARSKFTSLRMDLEIKSDAMFPCDVAYPFRDRDLISLLMAMPGEMVYEGGYRGIHRDAMAGVLPDSIRHRHTKAAFHEPSKLGAMKDLDRMAKGLPNGAAARLGYFQGGARLEAYLSELREALREGTTGRATWLTVDVLGIEEWLSVFFMEDERRLAV